MSEQTPLARKRRGPAPTGVGKTIGVRMHPDDLAALDAWREAQDSPPTRPEAIRSLMKAALRVIGGGSLDV